MVTKKEAKQKTNTVKGGGGQGTISKFLKMTKIYEILLRIDKINWNVLMVNI